MSAHLKSPSLVLMVLLAGLPAAPRALAQEDRRPRESLPPDDDGPAEGRGRRPRDPEELRRRIEELRSQDPQDPRIERLEQILKRLDSRRGPGPGEDAAFGPDRFGPGRFTEQQIQDFLKAHPELGGGSPPEASRAPGKGPHGRFGPDRPGLQRIMEVFEEGDVQRGELMINSATIQKQIHRSMR